MKTKFLNIFVSFCYFFMETVRKRSSQNLKNLPRFMQLRDHHGSLAADGVPNPEYTSNFKRLLRLVENFRAPNRENNNYSFIRLRPTMQSTRKFIRRAFLLMQRCLLNEKAAYQALRSPDLCTFGGGNSEYIEISAIQISS